MNRPLPINLAACLLGQLGVVILGLAATAPAALAEKGAAVVGSYQNRIYAERAQRRVREELAIDAVIVESEIGARRWYRVMVPHAEARGLVAYLLAEGVEGAWFLADPEKHSLAAGQPSAVDPPVGVADVRPAEPPRDEVSPAPVPGRAPSLAPVSGSQVLIGEIDGIPRHHIVVAKFADQEMGVIVDGRVDEPFWQSVPHYDNMLVSVPGSGEPGYYPSEVRMAASERGLYVSAVMYQPPETLVARLSVRDDHIDRDTFNLTLDTTGQGLFGYWFNVGLGGSLMDGKVLPERDYQRDWDGPWIGKSAQRDDGWSAELFLPWSMMNLPKVDGPRNIGFAVSRQVSHANERYQWPGYDYSSLQFVSALNTMEIVGVEPRQRLSVIPYLSATSDQARHEDEFRAGVDLVWHPSPLMKLTASAFPDFGAVEADDVVLNLTALETFYPEKRLFFLEGNEVFETTPRSSMSQNLRITTNDNFATTSRNVYSSTFVQPPISLLNTRRIGGMANQVTVTGDVTPDRGERERRTDLLGASKFTGRVGDMRYGVMGAFEDDVEWLGTDAMGRSVDIDGEGRDFAIARFLYEDVGATRRSLGYLGTMVSGPLYDAVVHGIDGHYVSASGRLKADTQLVVSDIDERDVGYAGMVDLIYSQSGQIQHKIELDYFDEEVDFNYMGFLSRNDYAGMQYVLMYNSAEGTTHFKDIRGTIIARQEYNVSEGQVVDSGLYWRNSMVLPGRNTLKSALGYLPERYDDINSRGNGAYESEDRVWWDLLLATDAARMLSYSMSIGGLQEDLGDWTYNASFGVTFRPTNNVSVDLDVKYKDRDGWLVYQGGRNFGSYRADELSTGLKMNWFLSAQHQLRLSLQWVGVQAEEQAFWAVPVGDGELIPATRAPQDFTVSMLTAQLRYHWEIMPLTDFYLVYNISNNLPNQVDLGFSDLFGDTFDDPTEDSIIAKLRYRFGN